jgi:hypothetical protein
MNSPKNNSRFASSIATLFAVALGSGLGLVGTVDSQPLPVPVGAGGSAIVSVFVTHGLNNPRGLKFGPDGYLYVAEGGFGGTDSTAGPPPLCLQVPEVGPYTGSPTGSQISRVDVLGTVTPWVVGFPSSQTSAASGKLVSGVADVAFIGDTMYALIGGGGCSHGVPSKRNGVAQVAGHSWTYIANLSDWSLNHDVARPNLGDFEPDGTWYSMIAVRGDLYAVEPNHGEVVKVTTSGNVSRLVDISASQGHIVPTAIAYHGNFYVGNLDVFDPGTPPGSSNIYKVTPSGQIKIDTKGLALVTGLVFDNRARMYVLELGTDPATFGPGTGQIVRVDPSGRQKVIVTNLSFPTGITMGPDGSLYVSNVGFGPPPVGAGQIVKVELID